MGTKIVRIIVRKIIEIKKGFMTIRAYDVLYSKSNMLYSDKSYDHTY